MSGERDRDAERELRDVLRRGDPAADGREPDPAEVARLRAAVVGMAPGARSPLLPRWAWAGAAVVAAGGVLVVVSLVGGRLPGVPAETPPEVAGLPQRHEPAAAPGPGSPFAGAGGPEDASRPSGAPARAGVPEATAAEPAVLAAERPPGEGAQPPRQIHFTGVRGTRIIWTLDPDFDL